ncbi:MAG: hypothetical protein M1289_02505 [Patescibacteria group bacterium]|nr:hypothetical protein [Patescibacteria group bacterium]
MENPAERFSNSIAQAAHKILSAYFKTILFLLPLILAFYLFLTPTNTASADYNACTHWHTVGCAQCDNGQQACTVQCDACAMSNSGEQCGASWSFMQSCGGGNNGGGNSGGGSTPPSCNSVTLNVSPQAVQTGGSVKFSISGDASTYYSDDFEGGAQCGNWSFNGGQGGSISCTAGTPARYTWTHTWKHCDSSFSNCSSQCSASIQYSVTWPPTPTPTPTPIPTATPVPTSTPANFSPADFNHDRYIDCIDFQDWNQADQLPPGASCNGSGTSVQCTYDKQTFYPITIASETATSLLDYQLWYNAYRVQPNATNCGQGS